MFARQFLMTREKTYASILRSRYLDARTIGIRPIDRIAYFGTYTVDEGSKTISFRIESTTLPNQLGMNQMRKITSLTADELSYTNDTPVAEPAHHIDTAYKRAK
jgi:hypothetical protein